MLLDPDKMSKIWLSQLQEQRAIAVIRAPEMKLAEQMALAVAVECS